MMWVLGDILSYHLGNLSECNLIAFRDKLSTFHHADKLQIPLSSLESTDSNGIKDLLINVYGQEAIAVACQVLNQCELYRPVEQLQEEMTCRMQYMEYVKERYKWIEYKNTLVGEVDAQIGNYFGLLVRNKERNDKNEIAIINTGRIHHLITKKKLSNKYPVVTSQNFFDPDKDGKIPRMVLLKGPAGIGKTMTVHKIMFDWASGNLYQDMFNYLFYIRCREVEYVGGGTSISSFISNICGLKCSDHMMTSILSNSNKILFIFDGLDELQFDLCDVPDIFANPFCTTFMEVLVDRILNKKILRESSIIITTRPNLHIPWKCVRFSRFVDVIGFTERDRADFFYSFFDSKEQGELALHGVVKNETLFTMCCSPVVCWIVCSVLKVQIDKGINVAQYQSITTVYMFYVKNLLTNVERESKPILLNAMKRLGALANYGIWHRKIVFSEELIDQHGLTISEIMSLFVNENIFIRNGNSNTYSFIHLSVQEFFAALYYLLLDVESSEGVRFFHSQSELTVLLDHVFKTPTVRFTLRFLFGLSGEEPKSEIEKLFVCKLLSRTKCNLLVWLEKMFHLSDDEENTNCLDIIVYLYEVHDKLFVRRLMETFWDLHFTNIKGTDVLMRPLSYCLTVSLKDDHSIIFEKCIMHRKPQEKECPMHAKYKELRLISCHLTKAYCEDLNLIIISHKSLLRLSVNNSRLPKLGLKYICEGVVNTNCVLQELRLTSCGLTLPDCEHLRNVVMKNKSLVSLILDDNRLLDSGAKRICDGLISPYGTLEELSLKNCGLTSSCCEYLCYMLRNETLKKLHLNLNQIEDQGVRDLCGGLRHPSCRLQELSLVSCALTSASSGILSSFLTEKSSLTSLDLGSNELLDLGVKCLSVGLTDPACTLKELGLSNCHLTSACFDAILCIIINNKSLNTLDLEKLELLGLEVKRLQFRLIQSNSTLQKVRLNQGWIDVSKIRMRAAQKHMPSNPSSGCPEPFKKPYPVRPKDKERPSTSLVSKVTQTGEDD